MSRAKLVTLVAILSALVACKSEDDKPGDAANAGVGGEAGGAGTVAAGSGGAGGSVAGSGGAGGSVAENPNAVSMDAAKDPTTPLDRLPNACVGFTVAGSEYSPGGSALPNTCAPFHATLNNPYAVRCVDADPAFDSGYLGDEMCVLPPTPELGMQIHLDPGDYANPASGFTLEPGDEIDNFYYANAGNEGEKYFFRVNLRMRPGSHHIINRMLNDDRADGWSDQGDTGFGSGGSNSRGFLGAQRPDEDRPKGTLEVPPEMVGLGDVMNDDQQFSFNMHHFNLTDEAVLREVWINVWYMDESEVTDKIEGIALFASPVELAGISDGDHKVVHIECAVPGNTRILTLNGHRHASTDRFGAWLERDGENIPLYESFNYSDMPTYQYDSVTTNPTPSLESQADGAFTGILDVSPGDTLHFVCDIMNRSGGTLTPYANEVKTGEMCILFGSRVGDALCDGFLAGTPQ